MSFERRWILALGAACVLAAPGVTFGQISEPRELQPAFQGVSPPLRDLAAAFAAAPQRFAAGSKREIRNHTLDLRALKNGLRAAAPAAPLAGDPVRQTTDGVNGTTPLPGLSFEGTTDQDNGALLGFLIVPPDTNGDVGRKYFAQMNNLVFEFFDKKTGDSVLGPLPNNIFFTGTGNVCELTNDGDPIVLYDQQAKRWIFSQFALPVFNDGDFPDLDGHQCFAVSKTSDPFGSYYLYDFVMAKPEFGGVFAINDYPKLGLWRDGIYYTANDFECFLTSPTSCSFFFTDASAAAFDKRAMYKGQAAVAVQFKIGPLGATDEIFYSLLPGHWEGHDKPKHGEPNTFWQMFDSEQFTFSGSAGPDGVLHWDFFADFDDPEDSKFVARGLVELPEFESFVCPTRNCIDQPPPGDTASGQGLDGIDFRFMYRAQYRKFDHYSAVVLSGTVDADGDFSNGVTEAGIRWAELRKDRRGHGHRGGKHGDGGPQGWSLHQAGTFAPTDGEQRFMPSIAQNKKGHIALGYTASSTNTFPSVRYTTRRRDDPKGEMTGGEVSCFEGTGSQINSFNRWGDYSSMSVDPKDDCTFWYTNEYYEATGLFDFKTRVCKFNPCRKHHDDDDDDDHDDDDDDDDHHRGK
jgi:hypothetical protein